MTQAGVHVIGEIKRGRAARQVDDFTLRREGIDAIREEFGAHALEKIRIADE